MLTHTGGGIRGGTISKTAATMDCTMPIPTPNAAHASKANRARPTISRNTNLARRCPMAERPRHQQRLLLASTDLEPSCPNRNLDAALSHTKPKAAKHIDNSMSPKSRFALPPLERKRMPCPPEAMRHWSSTPEMLLRRQALPNPAFAPCRNEASREQKTLLGHGPSADNSQKHPLG